MDSLVMTYKSSEGRYIRATIAKYHRLGALSTDTHCLTVLETWKSQIKTSAWFVSSEGRDGRI